MITKRFDFIVRWWSLLLLIFYVLGVFSLNYNKHGVWTTTYFSTRTQEEADETMRVLADSNVNEVYVSVWHEGQVMFESETMRNFVGDEGISDVKTLELMINARKKLPKNVSSNVKLFAWFEYGFIVAPKQVPTLNLPFHQKIEDLGLLLDNGKVSDDGFIWMNLTTKDVQDFVAGIIADSLVNYPEIDGVQLDDHCSWPAELDGNNKFSEVTEAARGIVSSVKSQVRRQFVFSIAPGPAGPSWGFKYNVDWPLWIQLGIFDEYIPLFYRTSFSAFKQIVDETFEKYVPQKQANLISAGTFASKDPEPNTCISWEEIEKMMEYSRSKNLLGTVIWFDQAVLKCYPEKFKEFWDFESGISMKGILELSPVSNK